MVNAMRLSSPLKSSLNASKTPLGEYSVTVGSRREPMALAATVRTSADPASTWNETKSRSPAGFTSPSTTSPMAARLAWGGVLLGSDSRMRAMKAFDGAAAGAPGRAVAPTGNTAGSYADRDGDLAGPGCCAVPEEVI